MNTTKSKPVTIADVARAAGVTKATVSFTLSGKRSASAKTREAIMRAVEELGYEPDRHAQRLSSGQQSNTVNLVSLSLDLGVGTQQLTRIRLMLDAKGYHVPVFTYGFCSERKLSEQIALLREVRQEKPTAVVCNIPGLEREAFSELQRYQENGGLVVCFGYGTAPLDCDHVVFDDLDNTYQSTRHLLELGHRKIGFSHHGFYANAREVEMHPRLLGMQRAHHEFGLEVNRDWIFCSNGADDIYEEGGYTLAQKFLSLDTQNRPTAMCITNDASASSFVNHILRAGLRVPHDVSVVGHDDVLAARHCIVPLTSVSQPVEEIAQQVLEMLCSRLDKSYEGQARYVKVCGALKVRESSASPV